MTACPACGSETRPGELFCRSCGARLQPDRSGPDGVTDEELSLFIGRNADVYLRKFKSFGNGSFAVTWHWPAFFASFWWMLYRKMYLWASLVFLLGCMPKVGLLAMVGFGLSANYLYFRHARAKVQELRSSVASESERAAALTRAGGVNNAALVAVPVAVALLGIIAAVAVPQFAGHRARAADAVAKQEIKNACRTGERLFAEDPARKTIEPDDLLHAGLMRTPEVEMTLEDGRRETFAISAKHRKGKTTFRTNSQCVLAEEVPGD